MKWRYSHICKKDTNIVSTMLNKGACKLGACEKAVRLESWLVYLKSILYPINTFSTKIHRFWHLVIVFLLQS